MEKGIDAMVGLIIEAGSNPLNKDDKMHVLGGWLAKDCPR